MNTTSTPQKPSSYALHYEGHALEPLFAPKTVAVIGATERPGTVGRTVLWNLLSSPFGGIVFPVNLRRASVLGVRAYASVADVPEPVDLAIITTPARTVPAIIRQSVDAGVKIAIIMSPGFKEAGPEGLALEHQVVKEARRGRLRILGPNCMGVMSPLTGLNATFAPTIARQGSVAFISQSGALCAAVLDWSVRLNVGFSHFVSVGSMIDVGWGDLIDYLDDDPRTRSILIYMESIGDHARSFLSAAREVALSKPIIVFKSGRTEGASRAAVSHTGTITGSDEVFDAAFRRCGVLRVNGISELFYMAEVLGCQPRPKGPRLTIVTNAGGPGVIATDALLQNGGELAPISPESLVAYDATLPAEWSRSNPIDIGGEADAERFAKTMEIALKDPGSDGLLVVLTPQAMTDPTETADRLRQCAAASEKPVLASWMGGADVAAGDAILSRGNIPTFPYPDTAARVFAMMWKYSYALRGLYETPLLPPHLHNGDSGRERAESLIAGVRAAGRTLLTEVESKRILSEYGIPTVETHPAATADEAVAIAARLGYPVVLKLYSQTITHKTAVGGVELNLGDEAAVRRAYEAIRQAITARAGAAHFGGVTVQPMMRIDGYELILGSSLDPQFGPVLLFGSGGRMVEVYRDRSLALPPLNTTLARRMMEQTRIFAALTGQGGCSPINTGALEELLVRFSYLVAEQPWIAEIDINPLVACRDELVALDARVVLQPLEVTADALPRLAIRPYPIQYVQQGALKDGTTVTLRPIRPEDEPAMVRFHEGLSDRSVYFRYFHMLNLAQRVAHERLTRICFIDYDREIALVAEQSDPAKGEHAIVAVGRLTRIHGTQDAEFAILVTDACQGKGLGTELLAALVDIAKAEGIEKVTADMLSENRDMQKVCERLGFTVSYVDQTQMLHAVRVI